MTKETGTAKTLGRNRQGIWLTKLRHIFDKLFEANNVFREQPWQTMLPDYHPSYTYGAKQRI